MNAVIQDSYGSSEVLHLGTTDTPTIGDNEVLLRVHAASINIGDWHLMTGLPRLTRFMGFGLRVPKARVRGLDVAGRVEAVGRRVTQFRAGDDVFGICGGSLAEYARARANQLAPLPANLSFQQAATVPVSAVTALRALRDAGRIQPGQRVLIIGAAGGVGLYAVQLALAFGTDVTGVCSSTKVELVASLGAHAVIDYTRSDVTRQETRYDLILDTAGNRPLSSLRRVLAPRGTLVIVGGEGGGPWLGTVNRQLGALLLSPFTRQKLGSLVSLVRRQELLCLKDFIEAGQLRPVLGGTYPLSEARAAMHCLETGQARGKLVIAVRE